jgi:phosphatidylserine decarboxylase
MMRSPLAGPGWKYVSFGLLVSCAGFLGFINCWLSLLAIPGLFLTGFALNFFRDPERKVPGDPKFIYSPCDGTVLAVRKEGPGDLMTVRIFMSPLNVHVNRSPIAGKIEKIVYHAGGFAAAMKPEARQNERNVVTFTDGSFRVVVEQISGFVARRIACWVKEGDMRASGERYGMIYYGSQSAVHLPESCRILVGPGDKCVGGMTRIAERA